MIQRIIALCVLLWAGAVHAEQLLREVIQHAQSGDGGEAPEVEIVVGTSLTLDGTFISTDGRTFTARVDATDASGKDWQFAELKFDEPGYDFTRVTMQGSPAKGFEIAVQFEEPVEVATLPQYANDRVALKYLTQREYRRAVDQARSPGTGDLWAVELVPERPLLRLDQTPRALLLDRVLYQAPRTSQPGPRLGFFTRDKARSVLSEVRGAFPNARVVAVNEHEAAFARRMRLNTERMTALFSAAAPPQQAPAAGPTINISAATTGTIQAPAPRPASKLVDWNEQVDDSLLKQAKDAFIAGNYDRSIALYTQAAEIPAFRLDALEMLGVTREQTGQLAQAKRAYETALAEFPKRPEAQRIRARLQALVSINVEPRALRTPDRKPLDTDPWQTSIVMSQFYRRYSVHIDQHGTTVPLNGLFSDVDLSVRRSSSTVSHEGRISLGHLLDFSDQSSGRDLRVQAAYWETSVEKLHTTVRLGRQSRHDSGVLGRFDGVDVTYAATPDVDVSVLGGYLLDSSYDNPGTDRPFWGVNAEFNLLDDNLSITPFYVQQMFDGVVDRQAVGMQGELYSDGGTYFGMIDYDLHHQALNHALLSANVRLGEATRVFGSIDQRRNPYLTTRNALIGQPVENLSDLELLLVEALVNKHLEDIAADRTSVSTTLRIGFDQRFGKDWAISTDASWMDFSATDTSLNVTGLDAHQDFYLNVQLRSENALGQGNYGAVQMRYYQSDTTSTTGVYFTNRMALGERWWLYPRLSVDQRKFDPGNQTQLRVKPSLRLDFRQNRQFRLELEVGYEWTTRDMATSSLDMQGLFIVAGWRALL